MLIGNQIGQVRPTCHCQRKSNNSSVFSGKNAGKFSMMFASKINGPKFSEPPSFEGLSNFEMRFPGYLLLFILLVHNKCQCHVTRLSCYYPALNGGVQRLNMHHSKQPHTFVGASSTSSTD